MPHQPPTVLVLCKGEQKRHFLRQLLPTDGILKHLEVQDLADYGCPSAYSLVECRSSTGARATVFAAWLRDRFPESLLMALANLPVEF